MQARPKIFRKMRKKNRGSPFIQIQTEQSHTFTQTHNINIIQQRPLVRNERRIDPGTIILGSLHHVWQVKCLPKMFIFFFGPRCKNVLRSE